MANMYATDGRCHNSAPGSYGHECGKPAVWVGTSASGFESGYCDDCREHGYEARQVVYWVAFAAAERATVARLRAELRALSPEARREFLAWARRAL